MSWDVRQTPRFARIYKKLHDNVVAEVDLSVATRFDVPLVTYRDGPQRALAKWTPPVEDDRRRFCLKLSGSERWIVRVGRAEQIGLDEVGRDEVFARSLAVVAFDLGEVMGLEQHDEVVECALKWSTTTSSGSAGQVSGMDG